MEMREDSRTAAIYGLLAALVLVICGCSTAVEPGRKNASLFVTFTLPPRGSKTLVPPLDMTPTSYAVNAVGPSNTHADATSTGNGALLENLAVGNWTITATAVNKAGTAIACGNANTVVVADVRNELAVVLSPLPGTGRLELSVQWLAAAAPNPSVRSALCPSKGSEVPLDFSISGTSGSCTKSDLEVGYYTLQITLLSDGTAIGGATDVVRILKDQTTTGTFDFTADTGGSGSINVTMTPELCDPLVLEVAGRQSVLGLGQSMTLKPWPATECPSLNASWYADGALISSDFVAEIGPGLSLGSHRIDLAAYSADGTRAGSSSFRMRVAGPYPKGTLSLSTLIQDGAAGIDGLNACRSVCLSPDGASVYAAGYGDSSIAFFSRDIDTGALRFQTRYKDKNGPVSGLAGSESLVVSPDGLRVFAVGYSEGTLVVFARSAATGALTYLSTLRSADPGFEALAGAKSIAVSLDEKNVYCAGYSNGSIAVLGFDPVTGNLNLLQTLKSGEGGVACLGGASAVTVSPEGSQVFVASYNDDSLVVFGRDTATGLLNPLQVFTDGQAGCDGLNGADALCLSPDGSSLYVASYYDNAVACFARNAVSGVLTFGGFFKDGVGGVDGLYYARGVAVSTDGTSVYVSGAGDDSVAFFDRNPVTGGLVFRSFVNGMDGARGLSLSPDGKNCYVACTNANAVAILNRQNR